MSAPWICLFLAGCLEVVWALGIKYTEGFSKPMPSLITVGAMIASMWLSPALWGLSYFQKPTSRE